MSTNRFSIPAAIVVLLVVAVSVVASKRDSHPIYKFSTDQGLSSSVTYSILQDKKGFIWIGTEEGLNKFDGYHFTHFNADKGRHSLTHNRTQTLYNAPDGSIWIGTSNGLNVYDYKADSIIQVRTTTSPMKLLYNDITVLSGSNTATTWVGTYGNGVHYYDWKKKKFERLALEKAGDVSPLFVMSLFEDDNNRLWIGTRHDGLFCYDLTSRKLSYMELPENSMFIRTIFQDSFRRIWIGTSGGCFLYNETTNQPDNISYPMALQFNSIGSIIEDTQGKIWIGTEMNSAGNNVISFSVRSFSTTQYFDYRYLSYGSSNETLNCPSINALLADRDNNVWIGTAWGGLNMLRGNPPKFHHYKHENNTQSSLPSSPLTALYADRSQIYVATMGTDKRGVGVFDLTTEVYTDFSAEKRLNDFIFQAILKDHQGNIWLGTYNKGLIKTDGRGKIVKHYTYSSNDAFTIPDNDIRAIYQSSIDQKLWISTSNGVASYDFKTSKLTRLAAIRERTSVRCIKEDTKGTLWIGTYGAGVMAYQQSKDILLSNPIGINTGIVADILFHNDSLWIATRSEGLILFDTKNRTQRHYDDQKVGCNDVRSLVREQSGNIWFATPRGIGSISPLTHEVKMYTTQDGVQSGEFYERSAVATPDGYLVFAGFGGVNVFHPRLVTKNDKCPPVVFTKLQIFNDIIYPSDDRKTKGVLSENISTAKEMIVNYKQSVFTLEFAGINYYASRKIQYSYFLEGADKKWNNLGVQNSVTFRNLKPGKYIFRVKASSPDAVWSDLNEASIKIRVLPPFWKTKGAYLIYFVLIGGLLYFAWQFATIRIRATNAVKIEVARREKEEELHQEKLQFFTNISHEFRTPLTLIISPLEKIFSDENNQERRLHFHLMLKNARRLQTMVNQLLDFRKAERGQIKLKIQYADVIPVLQEIFLAFEDLKKENHIHFEFTHPSPELFGWFDADVLNKSIINLLSNAYKFTPAHGSINVNVHHFEKENDQQMLRILVTDSGKGINPEDISFIFDRFYQARDQSLSHKGSGIGLHLTRSLVELHRGSIKVESLPGEYTTFSIELPVYQLAFEQENIIAKSEVIDDTLLLPSDDQSVKSVQTNGSLHQKRILIVEDNEDIRKYILSILGSDYKVEEAANGLVGIEMANQNEYDLIISDLMMPELDGMEMCKQLKGSIETNHIPIILLTAKSDIETRIEGLDIGAESFITKPFHPKHLLVRVARLIELRELLKGRYSKIISLGDLSDSKASTPDELFMQKVIRLILEKLSDSELNGDVLANEFSISRMGLHRKIKALTGQSTGEFIRNIRLKKAAELLKSSGRNVSEVCYDVGFNSPSYFTTCFAEMYKTTPSEYMKRKG